MCGECMTTRRDRHNVSHRFIEVHAFCDVCHKSVAGRIYNCSVCPSKSRFSGAPREARR